MDTRRTIRGSVLVSVVTVVGTVAASFWAGGCTSYTKKTLYEGGPRTLGPEQPDVTTADTNAARLGSLPGPVQSAFVRDYSGATVTRVQMEPSGTGLMRYRVVYIQEGRPGQVVYASDGRDLADSGETVVVRQDESFVPVARPVTPASPTALPATRDVQ